MFRTASAAIGIITLSLRGRNGCPAVGADESLVHPLLQAARMIHVVAWSLHDREVSDGLRWYVLLHGLLDNLIVFVAVLIIMLTLSDRRIFLEHQRADGTHLLSILILRR